MVRHGARAHSQFFKAIGEGFYLNGTVKKAVIGMKMKMYELSVLHLCVVLFPFNG